MSEVTIREYSQIHFDIAEQIRKITLDAFGHIEIVNKYKWSIPSYTVYIEEDSQVASFVNLIERKVLFYYPQPEKNDEQGKTISIKIVGINNLITKPKYRNKGYASKLLKEVKHFAFDKLGYEYALLLCADEMIEYYEKNGWNKIDGELYFEQDGEEIKWESNFMILQKNALCELPQTVNLCGYPW